MSDPILRALFVTDTHNRGSSPSGRKDNFPQTILAKQRWVVELAAELAVDAVLHGGDHFDSYDVGHGMVNAVLQIYRPLTAAHTPLIGTFGSHDIHGYQEATLQRSALGSLMASETAIILRRGESIRVGDDIRITSIPHSPGLDGGRGRYFIDHEDDAAYDIVLAHGTLVEHSLPDGFDHTLLEEADVNADLVLSGDYHPGYGVYTRGDGVVFCNPGSLARLKGTKDSRSRIPSVAYIEIYGRDIAPRIDIVKCPVAVPGSDLFDDAAPVPPDENQIGRLVDFIKNETEQGVKFDPVDMLAQLPHGDNDPDLFEAGRSRAAKVIQSVQGTQ